MLLLFGGYRGSSHRLARHPIVRFPAVIADELDAAHPVRLLEVVVDGLALPALGFTPATPKKLGRPS